MRRLQAELSALGWTTAAVSLVEPRTDVIGLHAIMTNHRAGAAIALLPAPRGATDVWILDEVGMVVSRERFAAREMQSLVVLRTVERLRASRIASWIEHPKPQPSPKAAPPRVAMGPPPPQRSDVELPQTSRRHDGEAVISRSIHVLGGLAMGWAPGGLSPTGQLRLGVSWLPLRWFSADLVLLAPLVPARVAALEGEADVYLATAGLAARFLGGSPRSWIRPSIAAGLGLQLVHVRGRAAYPYASTDDTVACALPFVEGAVLIRLTRHLRLTLSYLVGMALRRPVVAFGGRPVAAVENPMLSGSVGLQLEVP